MSENRTPEEILALRLDLVLPPDKTSLPPQTPDQMVNTAAQIAKIRTPVLSDIAHAQSENKMLVAFDKQYRVQKRRQSRRWVSTVSRWAVATSFVLVLLMAGIIPASAGSLPGEPLYGVKRFVERVELALAAAPDTAARLQLEHAERRVSEALILLERDQFDISPLEEALTELKNAQQAASPQLEASLAFQWQQRTARKLIQIVMREGGKRGASEILPAASPNPTETLEATATATYPPIPTDIPSDEHDQATDCPGNSCNSAGIPGGQIDPENPPGQTGGRDDTPPDPPEPVDSGGGQGNNQGQGNSGNGGGAPAEPPPAHSGGISGNSNNDGSGQGNGNGNSNGQGKD